MNANTPHEILVEYKQVGNALRVTAVEPISGTEIIFQAPLNTHTVTLNRIAASKMRYVMEKKSRQ
jgi:hypothetical protein